MAVCRKEESAVEISKDKNFGEFVERHLGITSEDENKMLSYLGYKDLDAFIKDCLPAQIISKNELKLSAFPEALSEVQVLERLKKLASNNSVRRSLIGAGYYGTITPSVIKRNILENPGWYTQYTPYQAEISQGRLEALLNFQTMVSDLTGFPVANSSLLDEGTAAAEAINMCINVSDKKPENPKIFLSSACHPQTIAVVRTRANALGILIEVGDISKINYSEDLTVLLLQYPDTFGNIQDYGKVISEAKSHGVMSVVAADILALTILTSPAELGADAAVGNTQRFGVPLGYGGPHAAYLATKDEYKRLMPGRIVGLSKDVRGNPALRLALQTREQHIRREKATSNICTAQVLLAVMASMYAVYHGPKGLKKIAERINKLTKLLALSLEKGGVVVLNSHYFDTLHLKFNGSASEIQKRAEIKGYNLRKTGENTISISLDECSTESEVKELIEIISGASQKISIEDSSKLSSIPSDLSRKSDYLKNQVFNTYHSETEFLRYVKKLESRDLSLTASMIPLGSCTMKLNATTEMYPVSWPEFSSLHPFCPLDQAKGYQGLFTELESALAEITGFDAVSLQPNAGSQGEYAGLLAIRGYHDNNGGKHRNVCLIPKSAHGTNPATASMVNMKVVVVACDEKGNIDLNDLKLKVSEHEDNLACLMQTYPSTHGVYEETMQEVCKLIHDNGGQVYMDGANLNALVGLSKPKELGADVCHINLHKTFCIPHGGGGPGMGPIAVSKHLAPYLPSKESPVSAAEWGSASILVIPWVYIAMMAGPGLKKATEIAILNANYIAKKLDKYYPVLYRGAKGLVAHECILDLREYKKCGVEVEDVAKRLMDYGFHAPTVSFPVAGTLMVEPTESESRYEIDRFCDAMIAIHAEIKEVESGKADRVNNVLKNAPHTAREIASDSWNRPYSRETAAFPSEHVKQSKFWPFVGRIDGVYGDKNLVCTCPDMESYS